MSKKTLYLVDGTALCYRSFFALKLSNSSGLPVGAVYGFYRTLKKIISKYKPDYIGMCFDVSRKTFRQEKYKEYKSNRPSLPDDLKPQIPLIKKLVTSLGIKIIEKKGFEADDVIASLCKGARKDGLAVVVASPDKDLCQLIEANEVKVYNYSKDKFVNSDDFLGEYGFEPKLMVDYLALAGDSADNIPGAKGIGKVGAAKLVKEFGLIENIFKNLDKIPSKIQKVLIKCKEMIFLSKELVNLSYPELGVKLQDLEVKEPDSKGLYEMFCELEFKAFLKEIPTSPLNLDLEIKEGVPKKALKQLAKDEIFLLIQSENSFVFDKNKKCVYKVLTDELKDILEDEGVKKVSYGFKKQFNDYEGIEVKGLLFDIKIAAYLLESALPDYNLSTLVSHYLAEHFSDIASEVIPYFAYQLYRLLSVKLREEELDDLFYDVEMPLVSILSKMQKQGVKIDTKTLKSLRKKVDKKCDQLKIKIFDITGKEFNLNSPKQLAVILFDDLGITPLKKTKTGYSTNEEVLDKLSSKYPIASFILEYRHLNKLKTTYILPLIEGVETNNGILHAQFNQTGTQTGRLSSSSPNLQSIPTKGELAQGLREAFIPSEDTGYLLSGDYSQIELRILAHLSNDDNLIQAFEQDLDIHSFTAELLFGEKSEKSREIQRNIAKKVNFGIVYGMSSFGLSKELKIIPAEAQNFIDDYFSRYPRVKGYIKRTHRQAEKKGFVSTILGRRRKLPDINSSNMQLREFARRQATNAPIQGSCADLIKIAMVNIDKELLKKGLKAKLIMQIHDELVFDVPGNELDKVKIIVKKYMEGAMRLVVPIKINLKVGRNWGQMKESECI